jgi:hypothetical protein
MQQVAAPLIDQSGVARQPAPETAPAAETVPRSREALRERGRGER